MKFSESILNSIEPQKLKSWQNNIEMEENVRPDLAPNGQNSIKWANEHIYSDFLNLKQKFRNIDYNEFDEDL